MKVYITETLISEKDIDVPDDVLADGKLYEWLDENDCWPEFDEILRHDWYPSRIQNDAAE
jgi:hypothetical protein